MESRATSWLDALSSHPIFTLPPSTSDGGSLSTHPSLSELARPPSPSPFTPPILSKSFRGAKSTSSSRRAASEQGQLGLHQARVVLVRGVDLVVAVGQEIRIASLIDVKSKCEDGKTDQVDLGEYKILATPCINFDVQQLVLNSTSKLLAVVGLHTVAVIVLPRKGWATSVGQTLECRSLLVGRFYHSLPASPAVAQISWHPWGEHSSSLLVLTSDALLREYNIHSDVEEPAQTISFAPPTARDARESSIFSGDDADAAKAVSFTIGEGGADWGPLTVYCLMRSGDIYAACPFLPKKASLPASYIHALSCFVSAKVNYLSATDPNNSSQQLTPFSPSPSTSLAVSSRSFTASSASDAFPSHFESRYNLQLKYVTSLVHQTTTQSDRPSDPEGMDLDPIDELDRLVRVTAPRTPTPTRQGPFLMQPAPEDLDNGMEAKACDLVYVAYSSAAAAGEARKDDTPLGVFGVAWTDGKVDLCLEVEKIEAEWGDRNSSPRSGTGYEGEDEDEDGEDLPVLAVYETVDLGFASVRGARSATTVAPQFHTDPLYPDTLYISHSLGTHALLLSPWIDDLASAVADEIEDEDALQSEVERTMRKERGSEVIWVLKTAGVEEGEKEDLPVVGMVLVNDVYLGYSALMMTSALQLVGVELALRVDQSLSSVPSASDPSSTARGVSAEAPAYLSLLDEPFAIPSYLTKRAPTPRLALKPPPNSSLPPSKGAKPELVITADTLRFLGTTVEAFRGEIRELVSAANEVQCRLELQMKELSRQVGKLSELAKLSDGLRASTTGREGLAGRLDRVQENQKRLLVRTDRVLQRLMDAHEPVLSTYEKKWFDELGRLEKEVTEDRGGDGSLERRAERVAAQLDALRPALEEMRTRKETEARSKTVGRRDGGLDSPRGLGESQVQKLEVKLAEEAKLISDARTKLERLTAALANTSLL